MAKFAGKHYIITREGIKSYYNPFTFEANNLDHAIELMIEKFSIPNGEHKTPPTLKNKTTRNAVIDAWGTLNGYVYIYKPRT